MSSMVAVLEACLFYVCSGSHVQEVVVGVGANVWDCIRSLSVHVPVPKSCHVLSVSCHNV